MRQKILETSPKVEEDGLTRLIRLIDSYGQKKDEESLIKKETGRQNIEIKELLKKEIQEDISGKYVCATDKYVVTLSIEDSSTMNEERLIVFLKKKISKTKLKELGIIKTKEYVDESAISDAIFRDKLSAELVAEMDSCRDPGTKEVLRISKKKGE